MANPVPDRAKEPSTWLGLIFAAVSVFFGASHPEVNDPVFQASAVGFLSGLLNIFVKEKK